RERRALRHRGRADGRALARRLQRAARRGQLRVDDAVLRRRRPQAGRGTPPDWAAMSGRAALAVAVLLAALGGAPRAGDGQAPAPLRVDGAAALRHVERLVAIGPRVAGSPGGEKARAYIVGELRKAGVEAEVQPFEDMTPHGRMRMANV